MSARPVDPVVAQTVAQFVGQVRANLADLAPDVLEELVGGLEADLEDSLAELGPEGIEPQDVERRLGDPRAYAMELRTSAGLDAAGPAPQRRRFAVRSRDEVLDDLRRSAAPVTDAPWWPGVRDFLVVLRPLWWVARGYALGWLIGAFFGVGGLGTLLLQAALVVASVQLGRGAWAVRSGRQTSGLVVAGLVAAVALPFAAGAALGSNYVYYDNASVPSGLTRDGEPVTNIFPYDAQGRPLTGVQLFDQQGRPIDLEPGLETRQSGDRWWVTVAGGGGALRPNVVPLQEQSETTFDDQGNAVPGEVRDVVAPLPAVPPVVIPSPSATGTASPGPTATPPAADTATPTPTLTTPATATPTSTPGVTPAATPARPAP